MVQGWRFYTNSMGKIGKTDTGGFSMKLGFITSILDGWTYEQMMDFASEQGFECVEVACWPEEKAERSGFNPIKKETIVIPASKAPVLKFGKSFKDMFN